MEDFPQITILNQPQTYYRMRYAAEKRNKNYLRGDSNGKYVHVRLHDVLKSNGTLVIQCVSTESDNDGFYWKHPNKLISESNQTGIIQIPISFSNSNWIDIELKGLRILHAKRVEIDRNVRQLINLNKCCLAFQFFDCNGVIVASQLSNIISSEMNTIKVNSIIRPFDTFTGGHHVTFLIKKTSLEKIYLEMYDDQGWYVTITPVKYHQNNTLVYEIPSYNEWLTLETRQVKMKLVSRDQCSDEFDFTYEPFSTQNYKDFIVNSPAVNQFNDQDTFL